MKKVLSCTSQFLCHSALSSGCPEMTFAGKWVGDTSPSTQWSPQTPQKGLGRHSNKYWYWTCKMLFVSHWTQSQELFALNGRIHKWGQRLNYAGLFYHTDLRTTQQFLENNVKLCTFGTGMGGITKSIVKKSEPQCASTDPASASPGTSQKRNTRGNYWQISFSPCHGRMGINTYW